MKRILITGKNSYVGNSFEQWIADHRSELAEEYKIDKISLRSDNWEQADFSVYDSILHVAGIAHVDVRKVAESEQEQYYRVNRDLTLRVAKKAQQEGAKQFIFLSSIIVYGDAAPIGKPRVITEQTSPSPANFYGDSKLQAEEGLRELRREAQEQYARSEDAKPPMHLAIVRPPVIYGPGCKGNYRRLEQIAKITPVFPDIINEHSMLSVASLSRFLYLLIQNNESGTFYPQDRIYSCTSQLVRKLGAKEGRNITLTKAFNPALRFLSGKGSIGRTIDKAFGNLVYDKAMSRYKEDYNERPHGGAATRKAPNATVVTVTYNSEREIAATIESVLAQTSMPAEYLVIDGGSSDGTVAIAESYRERLLERGANMRIVSEPDKGIYDAMNKGIRLAEGDIIGFLNAGDRYEPGAIRYTRETFRRCDCDATFGDIRIVRTDGSSFIKRAKTRRFQTSRDWNHPTMFVRRELLQEHPFACKGVHDDYGLYLSLIKAGAKIRIIRRTLATFYMGGASNKRSIKAAAKRIRDRYKYCYRANGYSRLYLIECVAIEAAKWVLG